jgi:hypothetical protein
LVRPQTVVENTARRRNGQFAMTGANCPVLREPQPAAKSAQAAAKACATKRFSWRNQEAVPEPCAVLSCYDGGIWVKRRIIMGKYALIGGARFAIRELFV